MDAVGAIPIIIGFASYVLFSSSVAINYWQGKNSYSLTKGGFLAVIVSIFGMLSLFADFDNLSIIGVLSLVIFFSHEGGWPSQLLLRDSTDFDLDPPNLDNLDGIIIIIGILSMSLHVTPYVALTIILLRRRFSPDSKKYYVSDRSIDQTRTEAILSLAGVHTSEDAFFIIRSAIKKKDLNLETVFHGMDSNEDGRIDRKEFTEGLQALIGTEVAPLTAYTILKAIDLDDDGTIDLQEFSIALAHESKSEHNDSAEPEINDNASNKSFLPFGKKVVLSTSSSFTLFLITSACSMFLFLHSGDMVSNWGNASAYSHQFHCWFDSFHQEGPPCLGDPVSQFWLTNGEFSSTMFRGYMSTSPIGIDGPYIWILSTLFSILAICLNLHFAYRIGAIYKAEIQRKIDETRIVWSLSLDPNAIVNGKIEPLLPIVPARPPRIQYVYILFSIFIVFQIFAATSYYEKERYDIDDPGPYVEYYWESFDYYSADREYSSSTEGLIPMLASPCGSNLDSCITISDKSSGTATFEFDTDRWYLEITIGLLLQMLMMTLSVIPLIVTVRDRANSSAAMASIAPVSSLKHEPIPSVSELGGVFAEDDGTLQIDKVLEMLEAQIQEAKDEAESLKNELQDTKEQIVILEDTIEKKDIELAEMSQVRDEVATITENIVAEGGNSKFNIQDSAFSGDVYAGSNRIGTQVINDPSEIAKAVIEAYKAGRKERTVDD